MSYRVLFILSFAQVTVGDWNSAIFIAPLVSLFRVFFFCFFIWVFLNWSRGLLLYRFNGRTV